MRNEIGTEVIRFKCIPPKFPDESPMDYCAFRLLKRAIFKCHLKILDGLWNIVKEEWNKTNLDILKKFSFI